MAMGKNRSSGSSSKPAPKQEETKKLPCLRVQAGHVKLTVWENEGEYGKMYSAVLVKRYKSGEEWKETPSIDLNDFLAVAQCFEQAWRLAMEDKGQWCEFPQTDDNGDD